MFVDLSEKVWVVSAQLLKHGLQHLRVLCHEVAQNIEMGIGAKKVQRTATPSSASTPARTALRNTSVTSHTH